MLYSLRSGSGTRVAFLPCSTASHHERASQNFQNTVEAHDAVVHGAAGPDAPRLAGGENPLRLSLPLAPAFPAARQPVENFDV